MTEEQGDDAAATDKGQEHEPGAEVTSIFDSFDPPPEVDPNRFGPVPVVPGDQDQLAPGEGDDPDDDLVIVDEESPAPMGGAQEDGIAFDDVTLDALLGDAPTEATSAAGGAVDLPHWTEPATGQVPEAVSGDRADGEPWQDLAGPRWKGEGPDWAEEDIAKVLGSDGLDAGADDDLVLIEGADDDFSDLLPPAAGSPQRAGSAEQPRPEPESEPAERNIPVAIGAGLVMAAVALAAFRLSGNLWALGLVTIVAALAAVELFDSMRRAGLHPATLLGITAAVSFPLAVYARGDAAFPLMLALSVVFGALWYIVGADTHRPALNLGLTFLGISWIGGMAAFAALILLLPDGKSILVAAIIITVASDTFALAGGKAFGSRPFNRWSPNKTWEGTIVGFVAAVAAGAVVGLLEISPFSIDFTDALYLGLVGGLLAPLGDLTESMVKRDLGVKDMSHLIPGHGGVLDRIDGLLFVLPGAYYLALVLGLN